MKPVFRHRIVPVEINIGNTAKFECETEDAPNVSFKWFKDGHPIKEGEKFRIISRYSTSSLEFLSPTKDDSGEYACQATNQHGSDECSASLSVTGKSTTCFLPLCWLSLELLLVLKELFPTGYHHLLVFAGILLTNLGASDFVCLIVNCFLSFFALRGCFCLIGRF